MQRFKLRYNLRPLNPNAAAALDALRAGQCNAETTSVRCACGEFFESWLSNACQKCRLKCDHRAVPGYVIRRDGHVIPRAYCGFCGHRMADPMHGDWLYDYCFLDLRTQDPPEPCERCGSELGSQLHHWAPYAIFDDADSWPRSWLCPECHSAWHTAMRAASGHRLEPRAFVDTPRTLRFGLSLMAHAAQKPDTVTGSGEVA